MWARQGKEEVWAVGTLGSERALHIQRRTYLRGQFNGYCRALSMFNAQRAHNCVCIGFEATHLETLVNAEKYQSELSMVQCKTGEHTGLESPP